MSFIASVAARESRRKLVTFGSNRTNYDTPSLDLDTNGGPILAIFSAKSVGASAGTISLRVNGSTANIARSGFHAYSANAPATFNDATATLCTYNVANPAAGATIDIVVGIRQPKSGHRRMIECATLAVMDGTSGATEYHFGIWTFLSAVSNIDTLGIETTVATDLHQDSTCQVLWL